MKSVSIIIPMYNEEENIEAVIRDQADTLRLEKIPFEILACDDFSKDRTAAVVKQLQAEYPEVKLLTNQFSKGYAGGIKTGIANVSCDYFIVVTGDGSDFPADLVAFYRQAVEHDYHFVFGSRFIAGGAVYGYPLLKLLVNRIGNTFFRLLMWSKCDDFSNSFKLYSREFVSSFLPLESDGFEITIELCFKALKKSRHYTVVPNSWRNRAKGYSKMRMFKVIPRFVTRFVKIYWS